MGNTTLLDQLGHMVSSNWVFFVAFCLLLVSTLEKLSSLREPPVCLCKKSSFQVCFSSRSLKHHVLLSVGVLSVITIFGVLSPDNIYLLVVLFLYFKTPLTVHMSTVWLKLLSEDMERGTASRTVMTSVSSSSTFSDVPSLSYLPSMFPSTSSTSITMPARHKNMQGKGLEGNIDTTSRGEQELVEADQRSFSRNSSQSSFSESRQSSVTKSGEKLEREEREPSGCSSIIGSEISGGREVETRESEVKKEEEGGENHLVVSCTNSSYFTPVERPVKEKLAEERYFRRIF